ncbi:pilus assembly protein, partial [Acidobacteriota bacterium]
IYTAIPVSKGSGLSRLDFSESSMMILDPILQDVNSDSLGLINFIRGEGRNWKLGDINHSNPLILGPPNESPGMMGAGYEEFLSTWQDRRKVLLVGANDGMLHCFDVITGEELWAFIPFNLLPKLKFMWASDPETGERYFSRNVYVDGSPVVADVQINGTWKTILICGQGSGRGSIIAGGTTGNFYFALDVTDPLNPQPLWEFTHSTLGESWSVPVIGKVRKDGDDWAAFMGSGYDNNADQAVGNCFYAVDLSTGEAFWYFEAEDFDNRTVPGVVQNIPNTIPGSPSLVDVDNNGYSDRVFVGDLDGRIWKVNVEDSYAAFNSWQGEKIYTDSKNYPIITRPAIWINPAVEGSIPRIYFGTGGDDRAPDDAIYSFVALLDDDSLGREQKVEWYIGDPSFLNIGADKDVGDLDPGEKVWADPQISDEVVYFSTLTGSIESVDPCQNLSGIGKLYARFIEAKAGTIVGRSALKTSVGVLESLDLAIKTRSAVTVGDQERTESGVRKREIYIQEYDSTIQRLEQITGGLLKVRSWREIVRIIG